MFRAFYENTKTLIKTVCVALPVGITIVDVFGYVAKVDGSSMQPSLNPDASVSDFVFLHNWPIAKQAYNEIARGDIVALVSPRDPKQRLIKRVIGIEGDIVETGAHTFVRIPKGHCWVEGDHRGHSLDSTTFGPISFGLLKSKAKYIVWPPHRWQSLEGEMLKDRVPVNLRPGFKYSSADKIWGDY